MGEGLSRVIAGLMVWQWLGVAGVFVGGIAAAWLLQRLLLALLGYLARFTKTTADDRLVNAARGPLTFLFWAILFAFGARFLKLTPTALVTCDLLSRSAGI